MLEDITSDSLIVGLRTSLRCIESGDAKEAFVASDISPNIYEEIISVCKKNNVPVTEVPSKSALGKACRIDVDASVVVVKKS